VSIYSLSHLSDPVLMRNLAAVAARDRGTTAELLAHIAEVDARRLYLPAGYPSMYAFCVGDLHMSEDSACKRIRAARAARQFPAIFAAVAEGRLHLSAVVLLAPHLTPENAEGLLTGAALKSKAEIERLLAARFPRPDVPERVQVLPPAPSPALANEQTAPGVLALSAPGRIDDVDPRPKVAPLSPERFATQFTMGQRMHDKLRYAQALLGHQVPSGDVAQVFELGLDELIDKLERRKFAATLRPRPGKRASARPRHIPAEVKRSVWERDGGQCTFVSEAGHRCPARTRLEFDHMDPVARGGRATAERMRLRCRAHNLYGAERVFGADFMRRKREEARAAATAKAEAALAEAARKQAAEEVIPWLRALGIRGEEARRAAALCETVPEASLEQRLRLALSCFGKGPERRAAGA
jgi:hypothetical protein